MRVATVIRKLTLPALFLASCAPIPMIQSSRVTGKVGLGIAYTFSTQTIEVRDVDTGCGLNCDSTLKINIYEPGEQTEPRGYLRFGIKKRVELSVSAQPLFFAAMMGLQGNLKVALFERGTEQLFRNVSMAVFGGGDFFSYEWGIYKNAWGGIITGTHQDFGMIDLELLGMVSGSYFNQSIFNENQGDKSLYYKSVNLSLGCIARPFKQKFLELNTGVTFRAGLNKQYFTDLDYSRVKSSELLNFKINPVVFQCGAQLYIPDTRHKKDKP